MIYGILLESQIYAEKRKEIEPRLLEAYKGYYAEKKVPINTLPFRLLNLEREERIEKAEEQLDALELDPNLKIQMMNEAEEGAKKSMSINMSGLKNIIDSGDLEYGKRVYDEQSPLMREFFLKTLKLDFSE